MKKLISILLVMAMCLSLLAACAPAEEGKSDLAKAKEYLYSLYVDAAKETATDLEYPASVKGGDTYFDVEWTVEILSGAGEITVTDSENAGFVLVDLPAEPAEDITYKLTATIKTADGKQTETLTYEHVVPKFKVTSFAEYAAAANGDLIVAQGVVTAILSKTYGDSSNSLYFQDNDGGFYAYNLATDPVEDGIEVGMTVRVTGQKDLYNGTYEIVSGSAQIIDSNKTPAAAADWTEVYKNAADLKDASLTAQQAFLVTLKGVEITKQDDKYLKFKLGDKETYVYISSSNCPGTAEQEAAMIAEYNEKAGFVANVTGLVTLYNGSFYLTPCGPDAFEYLGLPELSDAEAVEFEKGNLTLPTTVNKDTEVELPVAGVVYEKVAITWAVEGEGAEIVDGKLVLTNGEEERVVTVTATLTAGEASENIAFEITLRAKPSATTVITLTETIVNGDKVVIYYPDSQKAISGDADGNKLLGVDAVVNGTVLTAPGAAFMDVVVDENGYYTFLVDGKYLTAGATGNSLTLADEASDYSLWTLETAEGGYYIKNVNAAYNGNSQYLEYYNKFTTYGFNETKANIYTFQFFKVTEEVKIDIAQHLADAALLENNTYLDVQTTFTGTVTGNVKPSSRTEGQFDFTLTDGTYSIRCYYVPVTGGTPVEGDTITVVGYLTAYNGNPQFNETASATLIAGGNEGGKEGGEEGEEVIVPETLAEQVEAAKALANGEYLPYETTMTGIVISTPTASTKVSGTWKLTLTDGNVTVDFYWVPVTGTPVEGCTITVTGALSAYNGNPQFTSTSAATVVEAPTTLAEQVAAAQALANGTYLPYYTVMTGTVSGEPTASTKVSGTWRLTLVDGDVTVSFYWVPVTGTPVEGSTITVTGRLTAYNGSAQFDSTATAVVAE